jgi:hypothetical protein
VENSCWTPSIFTWVIAAPGILVNSTRRNAFPMVTPNPRSRGWTVNVPVFPDLDVDLKSMFSSKDLLAI